MSEPSEIGSILSNVSKSQRLQLLLYIVFCHYVGWIIVKSDLILSVWDPITRMDFGMPKMLDAWIL